MRAWVYGLESQNGCSWHVSLDMRADRDHWTRQYGHAFKLRVMEPSLSFGQACELIRWMRPEAGPCSGNRQMSLLRLAARKIGLPDAVTAKWKLWEWKPHSSATGKSVQTPSLSALGALLAGRSLFIDEFQSLMVHEGREELAAQANYFLQLAWLQGRVVLEGAVHVNRNVRRLSALFRKQTVCRCRRCGNEQAREEDGASVQAEPITWTDCPDCGGPCPCCEACLTMGRSRYCAPLICGVDSSPAKRTATNPARDMDEFIVPWGLSDVQAEASRTALAFLKANETHTREKKLSVQPKAQFLIWAVTGAGKTEMIFPMIQYALNGGGRVAVATPRRDVVLELKPRLEKAFPHTRVVTLYGGSDQRWDRGELTIATTHQLMRFRNAFDLVIIDEIDALPYISKSK